MSYTSLSLDLYKRVIILIQSISMRFDSVKHYAIVTGLQIAPLFYCPLFV